MILFDYFWSEDMGQVIERMNQHLQEQNIGEQEQKVVEMIHDAMVYASSVNISPQEFLQVSFEYLVRVNRLASENNYNMPKGLRSEDLRKKTLLYFTMHGYLGDGDFNVFFKDGKYTIEVDVREITDDKK
jgi:hypothetical protein